MKTKTSLIQGFLELSWPLKIGLVLIGISFFIAIFAQAISPFGYNQIRADDFKFETLALPNQEHLFGTNSLGFDVFSRTLLGFQPALAAILISIPLGAGFGVVSGVLAALFRGWIDRLFSFIADLFFVLPSLVLSMVISLGIYSGQTGFFSGVASASISAAIVFAPKYFRSVRVEAAQVMASGYVQVSIATGVKTWRIALLQVLPNSLSVLPIVISRHAADVVLVLAGLGFLGLGITPDSGAEWGYDLSLAVGDLVAGVWWTALFPTLALLTLVIGLSLIAEWSAEYYSKRSEGSIG